MNEFLSINKTAELFGVSDEAVNKWIKQNKIKYKVYDGMYHIPRSQFNILSKDYIEKARTLLGEGDIELVNDSDIYEE